MIINISGKKDAAGHVIFQLPKLYFDRKFAYKIGVRLIHVQMSNLKVIVNDLLCLNTNLVDRSSMNPTQTIFHFWQRDNGALSSRAQQTVFYGLHLFDFENATLTPTSPPFEMMGAVDMYFAGTVGLRVDRGGSEGGINRVR